MHDYVYLQLVCDTQHRQFITTAVSRQHIISTYVYEKTCFFLQRFNTTYYIPVHLVIIVPINYWYQNVIHDSLSFSFRIVPCTIIHNAYLLNRFRVMLLHALVCTRVEELIREIFLYLGPTSDGVNDGQSISPPKRVPPP